MSLVEIKKVALSHSIDQVRDFARRHPNRLNNRFRLDSAMNSWTLLGHAAMSGDVDIVNYLVSMPGINIQSGSHKTSPLDWAVLENRVQIVHILVAHGASLTCCKQEQLAAFLLQHPLPHPAQPAQAPTQKKGEEWIPSQVQQHLSGEALAHMSGREIKQAFCQGTLPCGWSPHGVWLDIQQRTERHETRRRGQPLEQLVQKRDDLNQRRQLLEMELAEIKQQTAEVEDLIAQEQQIGPSPMEDLSSLLEFATRAIPIEQKLVSKLERELSKKKPKLAALDDNLSSRPKLSLMLNCMGIDASGIAATSSLDLAQFITRSKRGNVFACSLPDGISRNTVMDLLYCGELVRECKLPFSHECAVCRNRTAKELIKFLQENGIKLNEEALRQKEINGRRVLFCTKEDFPNQPADEVIKAVDALQALHEGHF